MRGSRNMHRRTNGAKPQRDTDGRRGPRPIGRIAKYEACPAPRRHGCRAASTWRVASDGHAARGRVARVRDAASAAGFIAAPPCRLDPANGRCCAARRCLRCAPVPAKLPLRLATDSHPARERRRRRRRRVAPGRPPARRRSRSGILRAGHSVAQTRRARTRAAVRSPRAGLAARAGVPVTSRPIRAARRPAGSSQASIDSCCGQPAVACPSRGMGG